MLGGLTWPRPLVMEAEAGALGEAAHHELRTTWVLQPLWRHSRLPQMEEEEAENKMHAPHALDAEGALALAVAR